MASSPTPTAQRRRGVWEPLPIIYYGYAIYPLSPSRRDTRISARTRLSSITEASTDDRFAYRDVVSLEVGDEVYAFERYTPRGKEVEGEWYRGYVVCTTRRPSVTWAMSAHDAVPTAPPRPPPKTEETQQVFLGIFPASHIHVRDQLADAEGRLADLAASFAASSPPHVNGHNGRPEDAPTLVRSKSVHTVKDRDDDDTPGSERKSFRLGPPADQASSSRAGLTVYPPSVRSLSRSSSPTSTHSHSRTHSRSTSINNGPPGLGGADEKPPLPRPTIKAADDTRSGASQPLIDEIASALREWHALAFHHLAARDYVRFRAVRELVDALHLGRRQLLAQTLSQEETAMLRRECVRQLVAGNVLQGLDVVVRHPVWGGLVTCDVVTEFPGAQGGANAAANAALQAALEVDRRNWVSAIRMYAMQVGLAYMDVGPHDSGPDVGLNGTPLPTVDFSTAGAPLPTPAHSAFPEAFPGGSLRARGGTVTSTSSPFPSSPLPQVASFSSSSTAAATLPTNFFHVFLDLRAFVASPCAPGETAELFFSLYDQAQARFVSEEFCAVLNHHGVLARDGGRSGRIRTLFTDLVKADVERPIWLVCRIVVRRAGMKASNGGGFVNGGTIEEEPGAETTGMGRRGSEAMVHVNGEGDREGGLAYRRPFGCAVLELTQLAKARVASEEGRWDAGAAKEHTMPIWVPVNESVFSMLHQDVIAGNTREYEKSPKAEMLAVSIKIFRGNAQTIVKENMSILQDAPLTLRLNFPDVVFPGDSRNELYVKLWAGDFAPTHTRTGSTSARRSMVVFPRMGQLGGALQGAAENVQVTIEVRDNEGRPIEHAISMGAGEPPVTHFHSIVFARNSQPTFGELVKVALPRTGLERWHLFFTFRHRSGRERGAPDRPFAFGFLPLVPDARAFLEDGEHVLVLYRADRLAQLAPETYLAATPELGPGQRVDQVSVPPEMQRIAQPLRDSATLRTSLTSTRFTQNTVLMHLFNWPQIADDRELLRTVLTKFTFVGEMEIVKFLRDIFDALFGLLASAHNQAGEFDRLVFDALVTVLGIVQDRRFSNFQPVLDVYIEQHFNSAAAASHMIHSMNQLLANPTAPDTASALRAALKVWHYVFKFIARSRELQKVKEVGMGGGATADHLELTFRRELRAHLAEVNKLMATTTPPSIIGTQTIALQHFTSILPELAKMFTTVELVTIATTFANSVARTRGKIVIWKLIMYLQMVKGFLFDNPQSRALLVEAVVIWIKPHFGRFDEYAHVTTADSESARDAARLAWMESTRLCVTIIAVMLDKLQQCLIDPSIITDRSRFRQEQDNVEYLLSLLPRLLDAYREFQSPQFMLSLEHTRTVTSQPAAVPVTFPESYPFSMLAYMPHSQRPPHASSSTSLADATFNPGLGETAIVFLVLILSSPKKHILEFFQSSFEIEGRDNFATLLSLFFNVATSILNNDAFPSNWLNVNILVHKVLIKIMEPIATLLEKEFIPNDEKSPSFNAGLWQQVFHMLLKLLSSEQLAIEECSPQKRRAVWRLAGDIRGEGAAILLRLWDSLGWSDDVSAEAGAITRYGRYQATLSSLVGQVVNLCLSHHDQLRNNGVQILYSMIVSEYYQSDHFDEIENEVVNKLDSLFMSDSKGDDISRAFFISQLRHLFDSSDVDEHLRNRVNSFLDSVDLFLELLLSVRALPEGEEFADDRVIATLRLMNFIRRIGRDEIYIKYVHQLVNMHLQSQNYVEAALTLKLHSDLHEWDLNSFVPPMEDLGLPQQSQFHRKETLCLLILDYLGKGKAWESAIEICKELEYQHSEVTFNYGRLSEILRHQAALLEHIVTDQRYYPDYFRVAYYGNFPTAIRNKQIIYRGYEWEKFGAFCERMLNKHPGAQLLKTMGDPPPDIRFGSDQYIQCTAVTPEPNRELPIFTNPDVPAAVRIYYEHCAVNTFSCSRPFIKRTRDGEEEQWIEKTYFTTEASFPTVLRRSDVLAVEVQEISPIDNAITEVQQRTKELTILYMKYSVLAKASQTVPTNALSMTLNSAVDAPANAGIALFRHYLSSEYSVRHPDRAETVEKLRQAIDDQVRAIDNCLKLHGQVCPPEMLSFHDTLEKFFKKNFHEEIKRLFDDTSINGDVSFGARSKRNGPSQYAGSHDQQSVNSARDPTLIAPLQLGHTPLSPIPLSPHFLSSQQGSSSKQTPLQRHLRHLARHGINGVSSGPENTTSDEHHSLASPPESLITVGNTTAPGAPSIAPSELRSITGSVKGRFSRLGSLSFRKRGG